MKLYAAGFNAWGQLQFENNARETDVEPDDLVVFTNVLEDKDIHDLQPQLCFTSVNTASHGVLVAGEAHGSPMPRRSFAEAVNGLVVAYDGHGALEQFASIKDFDVGKPERTFDGFRKVIQIVAYDTGFAALSAQGDVWTWGDSRFPECLGRDATDEKPADQPHLVDHLSNLPTGPIVQLAAGGYVLAALTSGHDLYCWGGYPGRDVVLEGLTAEPAPILVVPEDDPGVGDDAETDILSVGVGEAHMIVLTAAGQLRGIGSNANGQLGLGCEQQKTKHWVQLEPRLQKDERVVRVAAGPRSSFLFVEGGK